MQTFLARVYRVHVLPQWFSDHCYNHWIQYPFITTLAPEQGSPFSVQLEEIVPFMTFV